MLFTTKWLADVVFYHQSISFDGTAINTVTTDSRQKTDNALFIPLQGDTFDGHDYVKQAVDNGAVAVFWDENYQIPSFLPEEFPVFLVNDTLAALQKLAAAYRNKIDPTVIAITGSNGKTTTKDIVAAVVNSTYRIHYTKGNFNNHIGVPLTILSMPSETEVLVLEMGMNHFGEIEQLSNIAKPNHAIITNIGESHIEFLGSREGIAKAKLEIVYGLNKEGNLIIDGDEPLITDWQHRGDVISCGFRETNAVIINNVIVKQDATVFTLSDGKRYEISLLGKHHAKNASFAITVGNLLGIPTASIKQALHSLALTSMRFEMLKGKNGVSVINDAYNASPTSMKAAIEVVKQMTGFPEKVLILGDMMELGDWSNNLHRSVADVIDASITAVFTLGNYASEIVTELKQQETVVTCAHFTERNALVESLKPYLSGDSLLLFKASRSMHFESFVDPIITPD